MKPNSDIVAEIAHVAPFGIFLRTKEHEFFVDMPEISWVGPWNSSLRFKVGTLCRVLVLPEQEVGKYFRASIKRLYPEQDISRSFGKGASIYGTVTWRNDKEITISLNGGAAVDFSLCEGVGTALATAQLSDRIKLKIAGELDGPYLRLAPDNS